MKRQSDIPTTADSRTIPALEQVLLVEDERGHRDLLNTELAEAGYSVTAVASAEQALHALHSRRFDLVLSDLRLPGADGFVLLQTCRGLTPRPAFIMLTAFGTIDQAVQALQEGADDFLTKPVDLDHLRIRVARVLESQRMHQELLGLRERLGQHHFHGIIGESPAMLQLFDLVRRVAQADGPVLITGESGTGKEAIARAIHAEGPRAERPFVAINCAGIPEALLESELMGHIEGAFTGARRARKGLFAEASTGSLFLDEIAEMPLSMQAKLLRVLQDGRVRPLGSNTEFDTDVRIIAATNRSSEELRLGDAFREDLFFRLETFHVPVPPLRDRGEDLHRLLQHFLQRFTAESTIGVLGFEQQALRALECYSFPGNVRELMGLVERAVTLARDAWLTREDLPQRVLDAQEEALRRTPGKKSGISTAFPADLYRESQEFWPTLADVEQRYIEAVLKYTQGNKQQAARILGIGRKTLYRRIPPET